MKRLLAYLIVVISLGLTFNVNADAGVKSVPDQDLFINSSELSKLEKVKNIKNKKAKVNKYNHIFIGQKGLILHNGYGILKYEDGGIFVGYFHKGTMRDGSWIIKGMVNYETFEYEKKNKPKKDFNGVAIVTKSEFKPAKEFEIEYLLENIFLKNKISYEEYLKLTGKDKIIAKIQKDKPKVKVKAKVLDKDEKYYKYSKTGFNIYKGNVDDDVSAPYIIKAYYKDDCIQHGLIRYLNKETNQSKQDIFGIFANCEIFNSNSKFANVFLDEEGKVKEITLHKKDVSHIYGIRQLVGVEVGDTENNIGVKIISFQKNLPAIDTVLEKNDLLIKINGAPITSTFQFIQLIKEAPPNKKIKFDYIPYKDIKNEFNDTDIKSIYITPKLNKSKIELRLTYFPKDRVFHEYIFDHTLQKSNRLLDFIELKKDTQEWKDRQETLAKEFTELHDYYKLIEKVRDDKVPLFDFSQLYVVSNKTASNMIVKKTKDEFEPGTLDDKDPPIIKVKNNLTVNSTSYSIEGEVNDNSSDIIYIEVDGILSNTKGGKFTIDRFSPVDEVIKIVAIDKWGNRSEPSLVNIKINKKKTQLVKKLERLDPSIIKVNSSNNKVALIIGIEDYSRTPKASYANLDAKFFYEYAKNSFGLKEENIKLLINDEANLIDSLSALNKWLPGKVRKGQTELIIYFAGHGLASSDGKELYLLPQDGDSDLLARTGISRTELFSTITKLNPKNVLIFLDTCYSGVSRDEKSLLASARPIKIIADEQTNAPNNFTIFSASQLDQISSGLKEAKHGIFSYYLMKGLEGKADVNKDKDITNGELLAYMEQNVAQKASELGRQQNPSLAGDSDKILMSYR